MTENEPSMRELIEREGYFRCEEALKTIEFTTGQRVQLDYTNRLLRIEAPYPRIFRFSEVKSAKLQIDEVNSSGKSTSSLLGRAALLGVLTGGVGAVVGAMTAKTVHKREIKAVALVLSLPDSTIEVKHYLHRSGYFKGYIAQEAIEVGQRVLDKLREPEAPAAASATADSVDLAESLASLSDLHEKGLLTAEEFSRAKAKLLT